MAQRKVLTSRVIDVLAKLGFVEENREGDLIAFYRPQPGVVPTAIVLLTAYEDYVLDDILVMIRAAGENDELFLKELDATL
ncbi:MAG: hypothetical protein GEU28_00915 [Dehalococcoidia bacterium]|nr:hypothetical protein [Dehalococcoidia bacterium]